MRDAVRVDMRKNACGQARMFALDMPVNGRTRMQQACVVAGITP